MKPRIRIYFRSGKPWFVCVDGWDFIDFPGPISYYWEVFPDGIRRCLWRPL